MAVDLGVPEGIPQTGVFTSDQGYISILGEDIIRVSRASFTLDNGVGVYREARKRTGTTYAGLIRVTGQVTRAFINAAESRLAVGGNVNEINAEFSPGPGVISADKLATLLKKNSFKVAERNVYPPRIDVSLIINEDLIGSTSISTGALVVGNMQIFKAYNAIITNHVLSWDSRGLITSGPLNFLGSAIGWSYTP
jgi:hypothetical protein